MLSEKLISYFLKEDNDVSTSIMGGLSVNPSAGDREMHGNTNTVQDVLASDMTDEDMINSIQYINPLLATSHDLTDLTKHGQYDVLPGNTMQSRYKIKTNIKTKNDKSKLINKLVSVRPWDSVGETVGVFSDENIFGVKKYLGTGKIVRRIANARMLYPFYVLLIKGEYITVNAHQVFSLDKLSSMKKIQKIDSMKVPHAPFDNTEARVEKEEEKNLKDEIKDDQSKIDVKKEIQKYLDNPEGEEIELDFDEVKTLGMDFSLDPMNTVKFINTTYGMKKYRVVTEANEFNCKLENKTLEECVAVCKKVDDNIILGINRDKVHYPLYIVKRILLNDVEIAYIEDEKTGWIQGINEFGLSFINTKMQKNRKKAWTDVGDEIVGKTFMPNTYSENLKASNHMKILEMKSIDEVLDFFKIRENRFSGHTFLSDGKKAISIEITCKDKMMYVKEVNSSGEARTNHGIFFKDEGYNAKENPEHYESSVERLKDAEDAIIKEKDIFKVLNRKKYEYNSNNNIRRDTIKVFTNAQIVVNTTEKILDVHLIKGKFEAFRGIDNQLPKNYESKIRIKISIID